MAYHYRDPQHLHDIAERLPLIIVWRTALAVTFRRLFPRRQRKTIAAPHWRRQKDLGPTD